MTQLDWLGLFAGIGCGGTFCIFILVIPLWYRVNAALIRIAVLEAEVVNLHRQLSSSSPKLESKHRTMWG